MTSLSLPQAIGQLICPTLFGGQLRDRRFALDQAVDDLGRHQWGGYILFHGEREDTRQVLQALQAASAVPLLIAADLEQGAGQHIRGLSSFPNAMAIGATRDPDLAYQAGAWTAFEALSVGINWVLAPVADVNANPQNPIINVRSFGGDPEGVARMAAAFIRGVQHQGALACAKHFPGHGDTALDSHTRLAVVDADRTRLEVVEWPPFRAAIAAGVATLMTAHLALPRLGVTGPATLDRRIMTDLLRNEWGYQGLLVTDALVMGGITTTTDPLEASIQAIEAGCDMLLMPPDPMAARAALLAAVQSGRLSEARVFEAAGRVLAAKSRVRESSPPPAGDPSGLATAIAQRAITLAKGSLPAGPVVAVVVDDGAEPERVVEFSAILDAHGVSAISTERLPSVTDPILLAVFSPIRVSKDRSLLPQTLVDRLMALMAGKPHTVVSFGSPFVVAQFPEADGWILAYGSQTVQMKAAVEAILGERPYLGTCPVALPNQVGGAPDTPPPRSDGPAFA